MDISNKIFRKLDDLLEYCNNIKNENKKIVLCQGHFNVIHPGHLRFLEFAEKQGECLVVAVQGEKKLEPIVKDKFFNTEERAKGVASLEYVDKVIIFNDFSIDEIIQTVKPNIYVMGEEFSKKPDLVQTQIKLVENFNGKIIFSSGDIQYSSSEFLNKNLNDIKQERAVQFNSALKKQNISKNKLLEVCNECFHKHLLVIGDTIVDQYVVCDALGMSSEAPVVVVRELESKEFVGGAAIVARHVRAFESKCTFISLVGSDENSNVVKRELEKEKITYKFVVDEDRPTIFKIRYMVGTQKLLRVSRLKDHHINKKMEDEIIDYLDRISSELDGIIVSDFGYGIITPRILDYISKLAEKYSIKLFGDSQSSSQLGNVLKFNNYFLIKPTEKEARMALDDKYGGLEIIGKNLLEKTNAKNIVLTLGSEGFIAFKKTDDKFYVKTQHFPALNPDPVDVVGAGDSLLTALSASICAGADIMEASAIGAIVASIAVGKVGNIPVDIKEVKECIKLI